MVWRSDRFRGPIPVGQQLDGLGLYDGCLLTLHVAHFQHPRGPIVDRQQGPLMVLADHQIHLHIAHPLLLLDDPGTLVNVHTIFDLPPFSLQTAPFGVFPTLGPQMAVQPPAPLLVGPHVLVDPLGTRAFDALPLGLSGDLFRAQVLFQLTLHVRFHGSCEALSLGFGPLSLVPFALGQIRAVGPVATVAVTP